MTAAVTVMRGVGVLMAGLQALPREPYEAARVTAPHAADLPFPNPAVDAFDHSGRRVLRMIFAFKVFDEIFLLTHRRAGATPPSRLGLDPEGRVQTQRGRLRRLAGGGDYRPSWRWW